eukprot:Hpha_TRINITY_DN34148_c0_g1::TRINITY_DN34148_c0_g1_i2::g.75868::m.75868
METEHVLLERGELEDVTAIAEPLGAEEPYVPTSERNSSVHIFRKWLEEAQAAWEANPCDGTRKRLQDCERGLARVESRGQLYDVSEEGDTVTPMFENLIGRRKPPKGKLARSAKRFNKDLEKARERVNQRLREHKEKTWNRHKKPWKKRGKG